MDENSRPSAKVMASSRRSLLKQVATVGTLIGTSTFATRTGAAAPIGTLGVRFKGYHSDQARYGDGGGLITSITEFDPVSLPDYNLWILPVEVTVDSAYHNCSGCGVNDEVATSYQQFRWPNKRALTVFSDTSYNPYFTGASTRQAPPSDYNYEDYAQTAVSYGWRKLVGLVPYGSELTTALKMLYAMYVDFTRKDIRPDNRDITTTFDWLGGTHEASSWVKYEAQAPKNTEFTVTIVGKTNRNYISSINMSTRQDWYMFTPHVVPTSVTSMSSAELRDNDIVTIPMKKAERNPAKYGLTARLVNQISGDTIYIYKGNQPKLRRKKLNQNGNIKYVGG